jgi:predicted ArsR family transcriptional regulator
VWAAFDAVLDRPAPYDPSWVTIQEAADHYGFTESGVRRMLDKGVRAGAVDFQWQMREDTVGNPRKKKVYRVVSNAGGD